MANDYLTNCIWTLFPFMWFSFVIFENLPTYINGCRLTIIDSQDNKNINV